MDGTERQVSLGAGVGLGIVLGSALCFQCVSVGVSRYATPTSVASNKLWKWKNILVSLIHSALTGLWALVA